MNESFEADLDAMSLHAELSEDGRLIYGAYVTSKDDVFNEAASAHCNTDIYVELELKFPPSLLLDSILWDAGKSDLPSIDERPGVDKLREELVAMIARIDGLKYGPSAAGEN